MFEVCPKSYTLIGMHIWGTLVMLKLISFTSFCSGSVRKCLSKPHLGLSKCKDYWTHWEDQCDMGTLALQSRLAYLESYQRQWWSSKHLTSPQLLRFQDGYKRGGFRSAVVWAMGYIWLKGLQHVKACSRHSELWYHKSTIDIVLFFLWQVLLAIDATIGNQLSIYLLHILVHLGPFEGFRVILHSFSLRMLLILWLKIPHPQFRTTSFL